MSETPRFSPVQRPIVEACEYLGPDLVIWSKGASLYSSRGIDAEPVEIGRIRRPLMRRLLGATRLGRRLSRETFYVARPVGQEIFYCFGNEIGWFSNGEFCPIDGLINESKVLRDGIALMPDGSLIFGEYLPNEQRGPVHLYRVKQGVRHAEIVKTFGPGEVRHIHRCTWDPFSKRVIVTTGDIDGECRLLSFSPDFANSIALGRGGENWRIITTQFTDDAIYFGTDAEFQVNTINKLKRSDKTVSVLAEVNGPIFHSISFSGGILFFTAAELSPCQASPEAIAYWLDLASDEIIAVKSWQKDSLSKRYFQFGTVSVPIVEGAHSRVPISGVALQGFDAQFVDISVLSNS